MTRARRALCKTAVCLAVVLAGPVGAQDCPCRPAAKPGEVVVRVTPETFGTIEEPLPQKRERISKQLGRDILDFLDLELALLLVKAGEGPVSDETLAELRRHGSILLAERNQIYRGASDDPDWPHQWGLANSGQQMFCGAPDGMTDVSVTGAWAKSQGAGVVVAVIDSGVGDQGGPLGPDHPDLDGGQFWQNLGEVGHLQGSDDDGNGYVDDLWGWDFVEKDNTPQDETGHGTMVAAVLGAEAANRQAIAGVAPRATLMYLRFLDKRNEGTLAAAIQAIAYAAEEGAKVVNLSWSACQPDSALELEILKHSEVVFVSAAGNARRSLRECPEYPAAFSLDGGVPNLVSAMGVTCGRQRVMSSNWHADLAAPGEMIVAFNHKGVRKFPSGTSLATAHGSGVAALLRSLCAGLTADQVVERLKRTAELKQTTGLDASHGIVDADEALKAGC